MRQRSFGRRQSRKRFEYSICHAWLAYGAVKNALVARAVVRTRTRKAATQFAVMHGLLAFLERVNELNASESSRRRQSLGTVLRQAQFVAATRRLYRLGRASYE